MMQPVNGAAHRELKPAGQIPADAKLAAARSLVFGSGFWESLPRHERELKKSL
jgi:hypothetical protein